MTQTPVIPSVPVVHVVDDDPSVRDSLDLLLRSAGIHCESYPSAAAFLAGHRRSHPSCLLLDVRMPEMSGLELQPLLTQRGIDLPVIIVTGHGDIAMAVQALKMGAIDFIEKPCDDGVLLAAVEAALAEDGQRAGQSIQLAELQRRQSTLTEREREVMDLVVAGCLNKVVAARLGISDRTVEIHRSKVMHKMQAHTLSDLIRMAIRMENGQ
jgi:two-component system response regulator FixJ